MKDYVAFVLEHVVIFYLICINDNLPDCSCTLVQITNKLNNDCVLLRDCLSKKRV